jgi:hypothetical protein
MSAKVESTVKLKPGGWLDQQGRQTAQQVKDWPASQRRNVEFDSYANDKVGPSDESPLLPSKK